MLEKIINYLENQMSDEERADFEQQLATDKQLRQETELMKDTLLGIELFGDDTLRNKLVNIENGLEQKGFFRSEAIIKPMAASYFPKIYWAAAASFLGVFFCAWYFWQKPKNATDFVAPTPVLIQPIQKDTAITSPISTEIVGKTTLKKETQTPKIAQAIDLSEKEMQAKYAKYLAIAEENYSTTASAVFSTERSTDETPEKIIIDSVFQLLKQKKYQNATFLLENAAFSSKYDAKIKILKAHTYFLAKKYPNALTYFKALADNGKSIYTEEAEYHLLLCYLADYQHFKNNFNSLSSKILSDKEHAFHESTQRVISQIK